jgi:hypothetical protein
MPKRDLRGLGGPLCDGSRLPGDLWDGRKSDTITGFRECDKGTVHTGEALLFSQGIGK